MTVRLRPHHLLCVLTYVGAGYTPAFVANMDRIVARIGRGEGVLIVAGPDDICAPLVSGCGAHCHGVRVRSRDARAAASASRLLRRRIAPGARLVLGRAEVARLRRAFARGSVRGACVGCRWSGLCTSVAGRGFASVRLRPVAPLASPPGLG